ncbi:MAG: hypothetical protein QOH21_3734 [Acidobacteriota bacterium]|jgi:hypothetical protein|nr:hypothetical protein [Acidobacteriota bacterium]
MASIFIDPAIDTAPPITSPEKDAARTAGILLLVASCIDLITWAVQARWGWTPTALGVGDTALQTVLGIGLFCFGRRWALPTIVFLLTLVVFSVARSVLVSDVPPVYVGVVMLGPVVFGGLRLAPMLLLLTRRPTRLRSVAAISMFVLQQLVAIGLSALAIWATTGFDHPPVATLASTQTRSGDTVTLSLEGLRQSPRLGRRQLLS